MAFQIRLGTTQAIATNGNGVEGTTMVTIPVSSTYKTTSSTVVDGGRNTKGIFVGSVSRQGIRKVEMSWLVISSANYSKLGKFFNENFMFYAYYFDQDDNQFETRQFYVGDRVADVLQNKQWVEEVVNGEAVLKPQFVENLKLSFIEV